MQIRNAKQIEIKNKIEITNKILDMSGCQVVRFQSIAGWTCQSEW